MSLLLLFKQSAGGDVTAPVINITVGPTATKVSQVAGKNTSNLSIVSDEDFQAYQLRVVPNASSLVTEGTLVESGGSGTAGVAKALDVTGAELAAAVGSGTWTVKAFVQDNAGNWSTS